jgi:hypothetical protein
MFDLRVEKERSHVSLTLSNGASVQGSAFVAVGCAGHQGPERIKDLLNAEDGFFPFEVEEDGERHVALYHREHVMLVSLPTHDEPRQDPGYDVAVTRRVSVLLADGRRLNGRVRVYLPHGRDRLSDYARGSEAFRYLESANGTYIINARYIVELRELNER